MSSVHGTGSGDLLDQCIDALGDRDYTDNDDDSIKVAVIGKPNAGKSSMINKMLGEQRLIVSAIAATPRAGVDCQRTNCQVNYPVIDTAGLRRQSKINDKIEKYSVLRAHMAVERANVCILMIDAGSGITEQDEKISGIDHESGKAIIIAVNKWDTIEKDNSTVNEFTQKIRTALSFMPYAPIMFVSAKTGQRIDDLFERINYVYGQSTLRISTGMLNDVLAEATMRTQPPSDKGRRLKIYYMTQTGVTPPTFVIFCNSAELFHFSYQRYLENCLRHTFGFVGTPIKLIIREKGDEGV